MGFLAKFVHNKELLDQADKLLNWYYSCLTLISPTLNTKVRYYRVFRKKLDLTNPVTFHDKLLWLKLNQYIHDPLVAQCADKYRVRQYVAQCSCSALLNELYGVYSSAGEIDWDALPDRFVLKWNFGAGMNIICPDKHQLDRKKALRKLEKWGRSHCWLPAAELQYKGTPKKILCEKYLESEPNYSSVADYKVYCFHGEPQAVLVMHDRKCSVKSEFFDTDWQPLQNTDKYLSMASSTPRPACLEEMLTASRALSKPFPFVRCDFFISSGKLYFGELTFTPAGGLYTCETMVHDKSMSDLLHVPQ